MEVAVGADGIPLFPCPVPGVSRPSKCTYDAVTMAGRAIVVDNGSHTFRAGWAGELSPSVVFRSVIAKPRPKQGPPRTLVGEWGPGLSGWDFGKHTHRYCFENDVPINMEGQEAMLDWAFDRMGITGDYVAHSLLMTEPPLPPTGARSQLAQLVFEAYGVPALSYVAAAPAAFYHHHHQHHSLLQQQQQGLATALAGVELDPQQFCGSSSGLVICSGHSHTYVVPIYKGQPQWSASIRCWASGAAATGHLQQLLSVKYPLHAAGLLGNWQLVEGIKEGFCCAAADYRDALSYIAAQPEIAGGLGVKVQLPYVESPSRPSAVDLAVRAQEARARGRALADMRRRKMLEEKEEQLALMKEVQAGVDDAESLGGGAGGPSVQRLLRQAHVSSIDDLEKKISDLTAEVDRLRSQLGVAPQPAAAPTIPTPTEAADTPVDVMDVDQPVDEQDAAALAAAPVPLPGDGTVETATTFNTADPGNEADNEQEDVKDKGEDGETTSTVTVSQNGQDAGVQGTAAAARAAAVAGASEQQTDSAAAAAAVPAAENDDEATADEDNNSSDTVTDEGVLEEQGVLQEVLQQVKQIRKKQRQEVKRKVQQQERQQRRQQERQQQKMQQQQTELEINYLGIPDSMLTADQIKIKRRQQSMQGARIARERAAARKLQQQLEREQRMAIEDEQFASDPYGYLTTLQQRHQSASTRVEARKRKRLGQATAMEEEVNEGGITNKRRRDEKHRERMRLIAQAAAPTQKRDKKDKKGKDKRDKRDKRHGDKLTKRDRKGSSSLDEEGFGDEAADWEVYRAMDIRGSDSEAEAEEAAELAWTTQRLQQIGAAVAAAAAAAVTAQAGPEATAAAALQDDPAAAAVGSSRAASQEPPDLNSAAAGGSNLLDMAAAAIAGQLVSAAYPGAAAAALGQQQQGLGSIDLNLLGLGGLGFGGEAPAQTQHLTAEDYQLFLGVERIRVPELLFQPMALAGVDQAGLPELVTAAMRRLPAAVAAEVAKGGVILTGGNIMFPGMISRIEAELRAIRPPDQAIKIYTTSEPQLDTWRGAAALAAATGRTGPAAAAAVGFTGSSGGLVASGPFLYGDPFADGSGALSRALYEEAGVDYLREFRGFKYPEC